MLFSLTCPERVSALTKLDLRHCHILPEGVEFMLLSPRKRGTADQLPQGFFARFPSNSKLCPVETLRCYLKATRTIRPAIPSSKARSIIYLVCEASQTNFSSIFGEVATFSFEGLRSQ